VSHGIFGGFDAALNHADAYVGDGFRVIAPSRFEYLGSTNAGWCGRSRAG